MEQGGDKRTTSREAERVLVQVRRIIRAVDVQSKRVAKDTGLTIPQLVVLQAIADLGEVTSGRLSMQVSLSAATVTTILDKLEARALVERYRSVLDRRVVHARLTQAGRARLEGAPPLLHVRFTQAFGGLPPARQALILEALEEVADLLDPDRLDAAPLLEVGQLTD
jgi:DNA-binding MarR family transcriptional regulator